MKAMVIFDSVYGNTEEIANAIGAAVGVETRVLKANKAVLSDLNSVQLLIVGSPTYGGKPTPGMKEFLDRIQGVKLNGVTIAAFDTRASQKWVKIFGFAAGKIEKSLKAYGGIPSVKPEGFYVTGTKGPLAAGETRRASEWAKGIASSIRT